MNVTTVATLVPCLIDQANENMRRSKPGAQLNMTHVGYMEIDQSGVVKTNDFLTDVTDEFGNVQQDDFGPDGLQPTQYKVLDANPPNLEPDHLEISLEQKQGMPASPSAT